MGSDGVFRGFKGDLWVNMNHVCIVYIYIYNNLFGWCRWVFQRLQQQLNLNNSTSWEVSHGDQINQQFTRISRTIISQHHCYIPSGNGWFIQYMVNMACLWRIYG